MNLCRPSITRINDVPVLMPDEMTEQDRISVSMSVQAQAKQKLDHDLMWATCKIHGEIDFNKPIQTLPDLTPEDADL